MTTTLVSKRLSGNNQPQLAGLGAATRCDLEREFVRLLLLSAVGDPNAGRELAAASVLCGETSRAIDFVLGVGDRAAF